MYSHLSSSILGGGAKVGGGGQGTGGTGCNNSTNSSMSAITNVFPTTNTTVAGLPQQNLTSWCVFVYNLPSDATDLTLFQLFSKESKSGDVDKSTSYIYKYANRNNFLN